MTASSPSRYLCEYLKTNGQDIAWDLIGAGMFSAAATCVIMMQVTGQRRESGDHRGWGLRSVATVWLALACAAPQRVQARGKVRGAAGKWGCDHGGTSSHGSTWGCGCVQKQDQTQGTRPGKGL